MNKTFCALALLSGLAVSQAAIADSSFALGVYGGTTGAGIGATYKLSERVQLRGIVNHIDYSDDARIDDFEYDLDLKMTSVEALVDYFPFASGFRFTAGVMSNNNDITGNGVPRGAGFVEFGGEVFTSASIEDVDAKVEFNRVAPYLGLGYSNTFRGSPFSVSADAGVFFMGKPEATIRAQAASFAAPGVQEQLNAAARNEESELEDDVKRLRYYPLVRLGVTYAF